MAQIFHPSANTISRVTIFGALFFVGVGAWAWGTILRSPFVTRAQVIRDQPVPFSHQHHVQGLGIDCRYCHTSVEESAFAGIPPTKTCMTCHSQVWTEAPMLEPVRESYRTDRSIEWTRVHDLPDYTYFNHAIHLKKGIGCTECHGRVDEMRLMWRENTLHMEWCLQCHREPERFVRPREEIFNMTWVPGRTPLAERQALVEEYDIQKLDHCSVCHR